MSERADLLRSVEAALAEALPGFLPRQRWFGGKARGIEALAIEELVPLGPHARGAPGAPRWPEAGTNALAVARVRYADRASERYALLLGVRGSAEGLPGIAPLAGAGGPWLVEAAADPVAALALLAGLEPAEPGTARGGARLVAGDRFPGPRGRFSPSDLGPSEVAILRGEQSNTSIRCGAAHVFKLFRRLEEGESPELEIGRFLTGRTTFRAMPALRGSLTLETAVGARTTLGVVQDWIENQGDAWGHVVEVLAGGPRRAPGAAAGTAPGAGPAEPGGGLSEPGAATDPIGPASVPALETLEREMRGLGDTTAGFHLALASDPSDPAFAPEPARESDAAGWARDLRRRAALVVALVAESLDRLGAPERALAEEFLERSGEVAKRAALPPPDFARIRVHGDYHLGQTLRTGSGYSLVDFEGEPARALEERRAKHCALKDVAGMLRSFDYAAEAARLEAIGRRAAGPEATLEGASPARARAAAALRRAFLDGYLERARPGEAPFLPARPAGLEAWIAFFELDKAIYEVEYEVRSRPGWVSIPLRGILRILGVSR